MGESNIDRALEGAETGRSMLEAKSELIGCGAGQRLQDIQGVGRLGQQHEPRVVAEVEREELGMFGEAETLPDEQIEVTGEVVGEKERPEFLFVELSEVDRSGEELVAMVAGQPLDGATVLPPAVDGTVEGSTGSAIAVANEHVIGDRYCVDHFLERRHDLVWSIVEASGQIRDGEVVSLRRQDGAKLSHKGPATDHVHR